MGQVKALLPWGAQAATPLVRFQCDVLAGLRDVVVVTGCHAERVEAVTLPDNARFVRNSRWEDGRSTSVAAGATALRERAGGGLRAILVVAVDQPLEAATVERLLGALADTPNGLVQPGWTDAEGRPRRGHPLLFDATRLSELCAVHQLEQGLRTLVEAVEPRRVLPGTAGAGRDLNTPGAYRAALRELIE